MKLRPIVHLLTALAAFGAGCTLLYDAGDFTAKGPEDAGVTVTVDAAAEASLPVDPCEHVAPPPRPRGKDAQSPSQPKLTFALSHLALVAGNRDSLGFDLDGVCTCDTRPGAARGGASSCVPRKPEQVLCDGPGGRDNGAAALFSRIVSNKPDSSVDVGFDISAREGVESLLIELDEYDGTDADPEVFVALIDTPGLDPPSACDAGVPRGDGGVNGSGEPRPAWDGCDAWQLGQNSLLGDNPRTFTRNAWVSGGTLVARFGTLPIRIGAVEVVLFDAVLQAELRRNETTRLPRLANGVISGRVQGGDLVRAFGEQKIGEKPFCQDTVTYTLFRSAACDTLDLSGSEDARAPCDSMSFSVELEAELARRGQKAPSAVTASACADAGLATDCP